MSLMYSDSHLISFGDASPDDSSDSFIPIALFKVYIRRKHARGGSLQFLPSLLLSPHNSSLMLELEYMQILN